MILNFSSFISDSQQATAYKGFVCFKIRSCDYMIVCLKNGNYSVCEDYYDKCEEGDVLVGEFQSYGFTDAYNLTRDEEVKIYVEDWEYTSEGAVEKWKHQCN